MVRGILPKSLCWGSPCLLPVFLGKPYKIFVVADMHICRLSQDVLAKLQSEFEAQMTKKRAIEDNAARTRSRMEQVADLWVVVHPRLTYY